MRLPILALPSLAFWLGHTHALPLDMPPKPGDRAVLVQVVRPPGGDPTAAPSANDLLLHENDDAGPTSRARPAALVAAETTVVLTAPGGERTVVYYQEQNTRVAHTSRHESESASASAAAAPSDAPRPGRDDEDEVTGEAGTWLRLHNDARREYGAGELRWSGDLREKARRNAELCTGDHSNAGENIAAQSGGITPEIAVEWWMNEAEFYDWDKPGFEDRTGHFTQVVWKDVRSVGCYIARCAPGTVFPEEYGESFQATCEYDPAGNYVNEGEFERNVGRRGDRATR